MRILLQHKETGVYLRDIGEWVRSSMEAMDFMSSTAATEFCLANDISGVQLVLKFDGQKYDIVLPMLPPQSFECLRMAHAV